MVKSEIEADDITRQLRQICIANDVHFETRVKTEPEDGRPYEVERHITAKIRIRKSKS